MSGQVIGGVIGAVIGSFIPGVGTQLGWMIGSAIGGYVDPTQVYGPRLKDVRGQTSAVGGAIPRAWGTAPVPGNIIWQQENPPVTEHENTDDGKGSGTEQVTYTYTRSYAVMFHLGEIAGVLQIKRNGKIVYVARDDDTMLAEYEASLGPLETVDEYFNRLRLQRAVNSRWMNKCRIYLGTQDQEPDPTIESYLGVGNVPAYRGRAYMVVTDDETQAGEIAQFEIIVSTLGTVVPTECIDLSTVFAAWDVAGAGTLLKSDTGEEWSASDTEASGLATAATFVDSYNGVMFALNDSGAGRYTTDIGLTWSAVSGLPAKAPKSMISASGQTMLFVQDGTSFYEYSGAGVFTAQPLSVSSRSWFGAAAGDDVVVVGTTNGQVNVRENGVWTLYTCIPASTDAVEKVVYSNGRFIASTSAGTSVYTSVDGQVWTEVATGLSFNIYGLAAGNGIVVACADTGETAYSLDGGDSWLEGEFTHPNSSTRHNHVVFHNDRFIMGALGGRIYTCERPNDWTLALDNTTGTASSIAPFRGESSLVEIPDAPGYYLQPDGTVASGCTGGTVTPTTVTLGTIVAAMCELSGLTTDEYDVSQLTDTLDGYVVARETDAASVIESLRPVGMFDPAEWDGKLRFIKRNGTAVGSINGDDLVERDGDAVEREMVQEVELLRKVSVGYLDTQAQWAPNTQPWERTVGTINARGESVVEVTAVMGADQAATIAKRKGLTSWGEPEKQKLSLLSLRHAKFTPTDILNYTDADAEVHPIRLMQIEDDSGIREIESSLNCAEAYNATATGVTPKPPTITDNSLRGPTNLVVMDLPLWNSGDTDDLGLYVAGRGYLGGWSGAVVDVSTDGGETYSRAADITAPATIGVTTTALAAWVNGEYPAEVSVTVSLPDAPSSVSYEALLRYTNRAAVQLDSGEWAILQYQTVTALGNDEYALSGILHGRYGTTPGAASAGAIFVLLDSAVQFVRADRFMLGTNLTVRATTLGTSTDAATPQVVAFTAGASQTEWPVFMVEAERDGSNNVTVTWQGRGRLGTETSPYHSVHFIGYRVTYSDGETYDVGTSVTTHTRSSAPLSQTITVAPLNDITGAGPTSAGITV